ncbi:MAG TPA: GNAT family N-acetyltransferase [Jatrophihabitans sp.]|jgi:GNAT superfamily N-acetyltransferase|nr:GNAT family N-acetyltransferase [Jatrophihabitans sp.]
MTAAELLAAYHQQVRGVLPSTQPAGVTVDQDGPLLRVSGGKHRGYVEYRDLAGLTGPALDALIERTCRYFGSHGEVFEWKTHSYDEPADLPERLKAAGFVAGEAETVVIGAAEELTDEPAPPAEVRIREVSDRADFDRIAALHTEIWNEDWSWLAQDLAERKAADPDRIAVFAAEAGADMISAAWLIRDPGSEFATLWGGATRADWRGRGIYRTLVARRAQYAVRVGAKYLQVDASSDSAPILQRLGFVAVATTTPYLWTPSGLAGDQPSTLSG